MTKIRPSDKPRPKVVMLKDGTIRVDWIPANMAVHHIDGNPRNNDPANLRMVVMSTRIEL